MARRHLIIGGGTAGINAIRALREEESEKSEITLVSAEKPYSRMVLPYYLDRSIAESHVYTATARVLADWGVKPHLGRKAAALDVKASVCTLDDGTKVEYDDCLIATGSSPVKAPVPGADGRAVHSFWTFDEARAVVAEITPGSHVVMVSAGFIAFTILNSILALGAKLTIVEVAPRILPRMIDDTGAGLVETWLKQHGVAIRTGVKLTKIADAKGRKQLKFASGADLVCDVVIMATGIKTNLDWLKGSGVMINRGVVVDDHLRSSVPNVYAAGDIAEGRDRVTGEPAVHAIEPTAKEHGRIAGANMAGKDVRYRGSLIINIGKLHRQRLARQSQRLRERQPIALELAQADDLLLGAQYGKLGFPIVINIRRRQAHNICKGWKPHRLSQPQPFDLPVENHLRSARVAYRHVGRPITVEIADH